MDAFVVDVNVAIVANGKKSPQADFACRLACVKALKQVRDNLICLDDGDHILSEYRNNLSMSGQPGVGDEFMYWLHQNQYTKTVCEQVVIHKHAKRVFEEFPDDSALAAFDRSDRKYVAVALTSRNQPTILNAVDSDWWEFKKPLEAHAVVIQFLCGTTLFSGEKTN